jgi:hypothetical protein
MLRPKYVTNYNKALPVPTTVLTTLPDSSQEPHKEKNVHWHWTEEETEPQLKLHGQGQTGNKEWSWVYSLSSDDPTTALNEKR